MPRYVSLFVTKEYFVYLELRIALFAIDVSRVIHAICPLRSIRAKNIENRPEPLASMYCQL